MQTDVTKIFIQMWGLMCDIHARQDMKYLIKSTLMMSDVKGKRIHRFSFAFDVTVHVSTRHFFFETF